MIENIKLFGYLLWVSLISMLSFYAVVGMLIFAVSGCSDDSQINSSSDVHIHSDECCVAITPQETVYVEIEIPCDKHGHGHGHDD